MRGFFFFSFLFFSFLLGPRLKERTGKGKREPERGSANREGEARTGKGKREQGRGEVRGTGPQPQMAPGDYSE
jgi:hypothetical protein